MRTTVAYADVCRRVAAVLAGLSLAGVIYAAQPDPAVKTPTMKFILSEFIDDPKVGKDPFFPNRRTPLPPGPGTEVVKTTSKLKLGGIIFSPTKENRLAIINNKTYSMGEEFETKEDNRTRKVRVDEIKDQSVIITLDGVVSQELTLPKNF